MGLDISQVKAAFTNLVSRGETERAGSTGRLDGASVRKAETATQPAHSSSLSDRIKAAFNDFKKSVSDLFSVKVSTPQSNADGTKALIRERFEYKVFNSPGTIDMNGPAMTPLMKNASSYALIREQAGAVAADPGKIGSFIRDGNVCSRVSATIGNGSQELNLISMELRDVIGKTPVVLSNASLGAADINNPGRYEAPAHKGLAGQHEAGLDRKALAEKSIETIDKVMCHVFGEPGNAASVNAAAARLPQDLCDQLAVMHRAIDDTPGLDAATRADLKLVCARDALALRAINPAIVARPDILKNDSAEMKDSIKSVSKAIQNLVNGVGISAVDKNEAPQEIQDAANAIGMKDRWEAGFEEFMNAAVARGNPQSIASAATEGTLIKTTYDHIKTAVG